jgi:RHH-type rel operon transcriptional repressor/antitoxin RelB
MTRETAIELPEEVLDRLSAVAARTGRTAESHMREAIEEDLEEWEDAFLTEQARERQRREDCRTYSLEEDSRDLALDD